MSARMPVLMAAQAVAMSARTGSLTAHAVDAVRVQAEELLERGDDLRSAVILFATQFEQFRRDAYALAKLGEQLERAISAALHPDARPTEPRMDIDG